jgi:hypothetical protein
MTHRFRLLAVGLTTTLATGGLGLGAPVAHADAAPTSVSKLYTCTGTLLGTTVGAADLTLLFDGLPSAPVTGSLTGVTASGPLSLGGLGSVLGLVSGLVANAKLPVGLGTDTAEIDLAPRLATTLTGLDIGLLGTLPDRQVPAGESLPLRAPSSFHIDLLGLPLLSNVLQSVGTITCTLASAVDSLVTTVVAAPGAANEPPVPGGVGTGQGPVLGGSHPVVDTSTENPCVATPAAKAGQRRTRLRATAARVSWKRRPAVEVTVKLRSTGARHGTVPVARGRVIACYGALRIGQRRLRAEAATLRTLRFYPGRYRVRLVYLGSAKARPAARTITLRVRR